MNILYHHRTQGKGVEGIHIRSIVLALRKLGHQVSIISPPGCDPFERKNETAGKAAGSLRRFMSWISKWSPEIVFESLEFLYNLRSYIGLKKHLQSQEIDLIYERYFLFSVASMLLAKSYNVPICYEVNDSSFVPRLRPLFFVKLANFLEKKAFGNAKALIAVSNQFKHELITASIPTKKIIVSHNAVDPEVFDRDKVKAASLEIGADKIVLGFVGLFVKWVGLDDLLHFFSKVCSRFPQAHLLLVGGGPEQVHLERTIDALNIQPHVTITGIVPHDLVPSYIKRMDICIIPKHERYTSPVKLFEYMAMGKAVLAPAYESIKEVVHHGRTGLLFTPNDEDHLFSLLASLIEDKDLLHAIGENARQEILTSFTWEHNARQIEGIVKNILT